MSKRLETVLVFGITLPKWEHCKQCGTKWACNFVEGVGYYQPCSNCRKKDEYRRELDQAHKEKQKTDKINDSLKAQLPVAVHTFNGKYIYSNHRGDILKEEKIRPMKRGEKFKK